MSVVARRNDSSRWTAAEGAIQAAMNLVEGLGADVALTDAVVLLGRAKDRVADFVDGVPGLTEAQRLEAAVRYSSLADDWRDWAIAFAGKPDLKAVQDKIEQLVANAGKGEDALVAQLGECEQEKDKVYGYLRAWHERVRQLDIFLQWSGASNLGEARQKIHDLQVEKSRLADAVAAFAGATPAEVKRLRAMELFFERVIRAVDAEAGSGDPDVAAIGAEARAAVGEYRATGGGRWARVGDLNQRVNVQQSFADSSPDRVAEKFVAALREHHDQAVQIDEEQRAKDAAERQAERARVQRNAEAQLALHERSVAASERLAAAMESIAKTLAE